MTADAADCVASGGGERFGGAAAASSDAPAPSFWGTPQRGGGSVSRDHRGNCSHA